MSEVQCTSDLPSGSQQLSSQDGFCQSHSCSDCRTSGVFCNRFVMVLASCMIVLSYIGLSASNHVEWDNYHWGQHHHDPRHPVSNEYHQQDQQDPDHYQQNQQNQVQFGPPNQGHYQQDQPNSYQTVQQNDQFQGYPAHTPNQPLTTMQPAPSTVLPTTQITPVPNSVPNDMPKHRILLRQLYQQVLGPNFTSPGVQLAFLSSPPSLPLNFHVEDYPQPQPAETQYDLPQFIEPPPHVSDQFNYYS